MTAVGEEFYPLYSAHTDEISMDPGLFRRIKTLYDNRIGRLYTARRCSAVEKAYKIWCAARLSSMPKGRNS